MPLITFQELPPVVRARVEQTTGSVLHSIDADHGARCVVGATLHTTGGSFFCKAVNSGSEDARMLAHQVAVDASVRAWSPAVVDSFQEAGMDVVLFDWVGGVKPDFSPGSPDLYPLARTLDELSRVLAPPVAIANTLAARWDFMVDANVVCGDFLVHTDVHPSNLISQGGRLHVIDWGWPCVGAPWVDTALVVTRLIAAGHTPREAQRWASGVRAWRNADPARVDSFAVSITELRVHRMRTMARSRVHRYAQFTEASAEWARYRRSLRPSILA